MTENIRYLNRINQLSEDDMRDYIVLHQLLEKEMSKSPKEMNLGLIDECSAQIDELVGEGPKRSSAAVQAQIQKILGIPSDGATKTRKPRPIATVDTKNRHRIRNFFVILAASLVLLYSSMAIAAKVQGYDNAWEFVTQKFIEIFNLDSGEALEEGNITLIAEDQVLYYSSVEELLCVEGENILYPTYIPTSNSLVSVYKYTQADRIKLALDFQNDNLFIYIKNYYTYDLSVTTGQEEYSNGLAIFYIVRLDNGYFQANCQYKGYEYTIMHNNHDELLKILQSMKGKTS